MNSIAKWAVSVRRKFQRLEDEGEPIDDPVTTQQYVSRSSLFHCPDCETVYIAIDKGSCSTCETTVNRVPALAEAE